jgi:hypothetical protein
VRRSRRRFYGLSTSQAATWLTAKLNAQRLGPRAFGCTKLGHCRSLVFCTNNPVVLYWFLSLRAGLPRPRDQLVSKWRHHRLTRLDRLAGQAFRAASLSACPSAPAGQDAGSRVRSFSSHALHLPRSRHAIRGCLRSRSSSLDRRICSRFHACVPSPRGTRRRSALCPHTTVDSAHPRTGPFLCVSPSSHPRQLSVFHSLPHFDRHFGGFHFDSFAHPHHSCSV